MREPQLGRRTGLHAQDRDGVGGHVRSIGPMQPVYALVATIARTFMRLWFRWDVRGLEHLPKAGPAIIATDHISYLDPFTVGYMLIRAGRRPRFLGKAELWRNPILRFLLNQMGHIPVDRKGDAANSLIHAEKALREGEVVVIYPEATIGPGRPMLPFKTGTARLSAVTGVPITPVATWGTQNFLPMKGRPRLGPGKQIRVAVGPPIPPNPDNRALTQDLYEGLTGLIDSIADPPLTD